MDKLCNTCGIEKPSDRFYRDAREDKNILSGYRQPCIKCTNSQRKEYNIQWRGAHRESAKATNRRAYEKDWNGRQKRARDWRLLNVYGITEIEYEWLFAQQNGTCAICKECCRTDVRYGGMKRLSIDHEHSHHENPKQACKDCIRGLLCSNCNRRFLPHVEEHVWLQNDFVKTYLNLRPFKICSLELNESFQPLLRHSNAHIFE